MVKCTKHPKYTGKRIPKTECTCCLTLYFQMHDKPRAPIKPTRIIRDKTKYRRKDKHKVKNE